MIGNGNTRGAISIDQLPTMVIGDFIFNTILSGWMGAKVYCQIPYHSSTCGLVHVYCNCHKSQTACVIIWINSNIYLN